MSFKDKIKIKKEELEEEITEHLKKCSEFAHSIEGYRIMLKVAKDIFEDD